MSEVTVIYSSTHVAVTAAYDGAFEAGLFRLGSGLLHVEILQLQ